MQLLGSFSLLAKCSSSKFVEKVEDVATQREGLHRDAKLLGKEKEEKKIEIERRRERGIHQVGNYRFKESGIGNSWLIGDDSDDSANAYVNYLKGCEPILTIPYELTDESGNNRKVEVSGKNGFNQCGNDYVNGTTHSIVLSKNIKVIKYKGLGEMPLVTSFRIEEGSCLETIEAYCLAHMSCFNNNEDDRKSILVLPPTVTNVEEDGLYGNHIIKTIYYCGSTHLSNYSKLANIISPPYIKVTRSYKYDTIF